MSNKKLLKAKNQIKLKHLFGSNKNVRQKSSPTLKINFKNNLNRSQNLTELCRKRLKFSEFRAINEYLYLNSSKSGFKYLKEKNRFNKYHQTYEEMTKKWPLKPVDWVAEKLINLYHENLSHRCIADIGCGQLPLLKINLDLSNIYSFDIISKHPDVIAANMEHIPLNNKSCDCVVFSLSLMATNLNDIILEANRICKVGGHLIIAEVVSRFEKESINNFMKKLENFGFKQYFQEFLPPNQYFVGLIATKLKDKSHLNIKKLPNLTLQPCEYKPR